MNVDERAADGGAHPVAAPEARPAAVEARRGVGEPPSDYVERIRRYVCGAASASLDPNSAARRQPAVQAAQCRRLLDSAAAEFAPWLDRAGTTVTEIVGATPGQLAAALTQMQCPAQRLTMSSDVILDNVLMLARDVMARRVPGDFIEAGAWRGGVAVLMRAAIAAYGANDVPQRTVWVADSFAGWPQPDPDSDLDDAVLHYLVKAIDGLRVDRPTLERGFARANLLDDQVRILEGWFADTLPAAPIGRLALARLDGDLHESTMTALLALYPRLSAGGFVIIDGYGSPTGCARAVDEYRATRGIAAPLQRVDQQAVYWCKPR